MNTPITAGYWIAIKGPGHGRTLPKIVTESREKTIAEVHFPNANPCAADFQEAYANLHAMAAVPALVEALEKINRVIYAAGAPLGSDNYFTIRGLCVGALKAAGQMGHEPKTEPSPNT